MKSKQYDYIIVESFRPSITTGLHGEIHIRPINDQGPYLKIFHVRCSKTLSNDYPAGTRFRIQAKITQRENGGFFIDSHYSWPYEVLK